MALLRSSGGNVSSSCEYVFSKCISCQRVMFHRSDVRACRPQHERVTKLYDMTPKTRLFSHGQPLVSAKFVTYLLMDCQPINSFQLSYFRQEQVTASFIGVSCFIRDSRRNQSYRLVLNWPRGSCRDLQPAGLEIVIYSLGGSQRYKVTGRPAAWP